MSGEGWVLMTFPPGSWSDVWGLVLKRLVIRVEDRTGMRHRPGRVSRLGGASFPPSQGLGVDVW